MKYLLVSVIILFSIGAFPSGKQFRPPAFDICKIKPDHEKCSKGDGNNAKETKEAKLENEKDKKKKVE